MLTSAVCIENWQDRLVTSANMADRVLEKSSKWPQFFFSNNVSEVSIFTKIHLLITNMLIFSQLDTPFPVKMA